MSRLDRAIPNPRDPDYREYVLFWNAVNNAVLEGIERKLRHHNPDAYPKDQPAAWIPLDWRDDIINAAWLEIIDNRRATCVHGPDYGGRCMSCGEQVFTRDADDNPVFP